MAMDIINTWVQKVQIFRLPPGGPLPKYPLAKQPPMEQLPGKLAVFHMPEPLAKHAPAILLPYSYPAIECLEKVGGVDIGGGETEKSVCLIGRKGEGIRVICFYHISSAATDLVVKLLLFNVFLGYKLNEID